MSGNCLETLSRTQVSRWLIGSAARSWHTGRTAAHGHRRCNWTHWEPRFTMPRPKNVPGGPDSFTRSSTMVVGSTLLSTLRRTPPCYTPEDCHRRAEVNERARATRGLPEYDHDVPELLAAMQQQDQMIADHKSAREQRARNAANMSPLKPARLPQVRCGGQCQAKGVWCCRLG